jgi:hypothetical protein
MGLPRMASSISDRLVVTGNQRGTRGPGVGTQPVGPPVAMSNPDPAPGNAVPISSTNTALPPMTQVLRSRRAGAVSFGGPRGAGPRGAAGTASLPGGLPRRVLRGPKPVPVGPQTADTRSVIGG